MSKRINLLLIILFTLTSFLTITFLTFFNPNFMLKEMDKYNYYRESTQSLCAYLDTNSINYSLNFNDYKQDIKKYVKSRYKDYEIKNKINSSIDTNNIYSDYVTFNKFFKKYHMHYLSYIWFLVVIILVIVTGLLFVKTKKFHNLQLITLVSSILLIIIYGSLTIWVDISNDFIYKCFSDSLSYLLAYAVILLEMSIIYKLKDYKKL